MLKQIEIIEDIEHKLLPIGIDLSDSFVLGFHLNKDKFIIDLELSIWPESPFYEQPNKDEYTCYKKGILRFSGLEMIEGFTELLSIKPSVDSDGTPDWGNIYALRKVSELIVFNIESTELKIKCKNFELIIFE